MEGEKEEQGEITQSGTTSTRSHTVTQSNQPQDLQEPGEDDRPEIEACDGEVEEDLCLCDAESLPQETPIGTNTQDVTHGLPLYPTPTEEELTPPSVSSHPLNTQSQSHTHTTDIMCVYPAQALHNNRVQLFSLCVLTGRPSEPCWYCRRSLDSEYRPETTEQEDSGPLSPVPSSDQKVSYQTDPRPHFGVACSSHSTCHPLWGSEGPCWGPRSQDVLDQTDTCPHCHLGLPPDTLRWHEAKCLQFEGVRIPKK
uniref:uncharacterized protein LOC120821425 isoform X2 n=1 Tax=Gasterosteus aculeatus aculeatus TaxID=481459 RepID=UPI001A997446|nr:uncharacterized protein LOC120821425 isoform X2 [Gasterosteus aculeatus aculeatus]